MDSGGCGSGKWFMRWLMKSSTTGLARGAVDWPSDNSTHMDCSTLSTSRELPPKTHLGRIGQFDSAKAWTLPVHAMVSCRCRQVTQRPAPAWDTHACDGGEHREDGKWICRETRSARATATVWSESRRNTFLGRRRRCGASGRKASMTSPVALPPPVSGGCSLRGVEAWDGDGAWSRTQAAVPSARDSRAPSLRVQQQPAIMPPDVQFQREPAAGSVEMRRGEASGEDCKVDVCVLHRCARLLAPEAARTCLRPVVVSRCQQRL